MQCHSHSPPISYRNRTYDWTADHKMCNVTHKLFVIGDMCQWDCLSQDVQCHSQAVGHRKECMKVPFTKHAMSDTLAVGHRKRWHEAAFHKMCNDTYLLLVIGNVMRLPFTKCGMSLTDYWS